MSTGASGPRPVLTTLRGIGIEPGDVVYLLAANRQSVRFCNVEDVDFGDHRLLVSFPVQRLLHREHSQWVRVDDVIQAEELQTTPISNTHVNGELLLSHEPPDHVAGFLVDGDLDGTMIPVRRAAFNADGTWVAVGKLEPRDISEMFHPQLWRAINRWRYNQLVDPLFDVLSKEIGERFQYDAAGLLIIRDVRVPVSAKLALENHHLVVNVAVNFGLAGLLGGVQYEGDQWLLPEDGDQRPRWRLRVAVDGVSLGFNAQGYRGSVSIIPAGFTLELGDQATAIATRETFIGAPIGAWSHSIYTREPALPALGPQFARVPDSIQFALYGRRAIIYTPQARNDSTEYTSLLYLGDTLSSHERAVVSALLGYLTGGRARNVMTETFAIDRKLSVEIHDRGDPTFRRSPPIPIDHPSQYAGLIAAELPKLILAFDRWRTTDERSFEAVFHHYTEAVNSNYPVTRILQLAVALEAFINLVTQDIAVDEGIIVQDAFDSLKADLEAALKAHATGKEVFTDDVLRRYQTKIDNFNTGSNTRRIKTFWEIVPIAKDKDDDQLMRRLRHGSVHEGFVGNESTPEGLLENAADADRLVDLLNRAILTYAGYRGPVRRARDGAWIEPLKGELFKVPSLPKEGGVQLRIEHAPPPLTAAETAAAEQLRQMQRRSPTAIEDGPL